MIAIVGAIALGCAKPPPTLQLAQESLGFLLVGESSREQLVLRLGIPSYAFEDDRILLYRMTWTQDDGLRAIS